MVMPTTTLTRDERGTRSPRGTPQGDARGIADREHAHRVHRLKAALVIWALGAVAVTALWVMSQWQANGAFERFGHAGGQGEWNPTLWAVVVGLSGLVVGVMELGVHFDRSTSTAPMRRLKFHVATWVLAMLVLAPINLLIEWQDNGRFERWSTNSRPGSWDPWALRIGAVWAGVIALAALWERVSHRRGV
jgi:formate-dependent nitrite reductase membrane component NrfD